MLLKHSGFENTSEVCRTSEVDVLPLRHEAASFGDAI
jgi:hypothetical protein